MDATERLNECDSTKLHKVTIVSRKSWGARDSKEINYMGTPVSVIFVHHTNMGTCLTSEEGCREMRTIQDFHMDDRGWDDIGYNFLIDESGTVYEGRSWDRIGAHTLGWNDVAIAFSFMGDYCKKLPSAHALTTFQYMVENGIKLGKITPDYKVYGHRDVRDTECPGQVLYEHIRTWEHYDSWTPIKPEPIPYKPVTDMYWILCYTQLPHNSRVVRTAQCALFILLIHCFRHLFYYYMHKKLCPYCLLCSHLL